MKNMLTLFILFFLAVYIICETARPRKKMPDNKAILCVKLVSCICSVVFFVIYYMSEEGIVDRSSGISGLIMALAVYTAFIIKSILDIQNYNKRRTQNNEED